VLGVWSAPNFVGRCGNVGAMVHVESVGAYTPVTFRSAPKGRRGGLSGAADASGAVAEDTGGAGDAEAGDGSGGAGSGSSGGGVGGAGT